LLLRPEGGGKRRRKYKRQARRGVRQGRLANIAIEGSAATPFRSTGRRNRVCSIVAKRNVLLFGEGSALVIHKKLDRSLQVVYIFFSRKIGGSTARGLHKSRKDASGRGKFYGFSGSREKSKVYEKKSLHEVGKNPIVLDRERGIVLRRNPRA